jgi:hypothetical protein
MCPSYSKIYWNAVHEVLSIVIIVVSVQLGYVPLVGTVGNEWRNVGVISSKGKSNKRRRNGNRDNKQWMIKWTVWKWMEGKIRWWFSGSWYRGGGGGKLIYVDMDIVTKFRKEANEWRNGEKKSTSGMGSFHEAEECTRKREIHVGV